MRKIIFAVAVSLLALSIMSPSPAAGRCDRVLQDLRDRYGHLPGMSMGYTRHVITRALSMTGEKVTGDFAEGRLYVKPPDSLKLIQLRPVEEHLITEGRNVWWYIPDKERVDRYPASFFGKQLSLLNEIFQGFSEGARSFACRVEVRNEDTVLVLEPDPPWKDIDHITVTIDDDGAISSIGIRNHLGNITTFTLGPITVVDSFDRGYFTFSPPEGIRLQDRGNH